MDNVHSGGFGRGSLATAAHSPVPYIPPIFPKVCMLLTYCRVARSLARGRPRVPFAPFASIVLVCLATGCGGSPNPSWYVEDREPTPRHPCYPIRAPTLTPVTFMRCPMTSGGRSARQSRPFTWVTRCNASSRFWASQTGPTPATRAYLRRFIIGRISRTSLRNTTTIPTREMRTSVLTSTTMAAWSTFCRRIPESPVVGLLPHVPKASRRIGFHHATWRHPHSGGGCERRHH